MSALRASKKGQTFFIDLILGILIMTATLLSVVFLLPEHDPPFTDDVEHLQTLMTPGIPSDWNVTSVILAGFMTDGRFNETKIMAFENLSAQKQKQTLGIRSSYTIRFIMNSTNLSLCSTCGLQPVKYKQLLPIERTGILNNSITFMEVRLYK